MNKNKITRVRWLAALTLALLFFSFLTPFFLRLLPPGLPSTRLTPTPLFLEWEGAINLIFLLVVSLLNACFFVFFLRLFRGINRGKIFVPGNARWLYVGAWVPIVTLIYRVVYMCFVRGTSGLAVAVLAAQSWHNLTLFSGITLMALLYDVATDVSEENQLTV